MSMKIIDISLPIRSAMVVWPGDTKFARLESRGSAIISKLIMSSHTGTHIDAPKHFLFSKGGVDRIALYKLIGPAKVLEIKSRQQITKKDIEKYQIKRRDRILFKTRNSQLLKKKKFTADYVSLSLDAARYLAQKKIDLVGIDYFGIEAKGTTVHPVHKTLLSAGIVIVEGVDLARVKPGVYNIVALPLKIKNGDGSPARVVLLK